MRNHAPATDIVIGPGTHLDHYPFHDLGLTLRLGLRAVRVRNARPPQPANEIFVICKQWMWHIQHPEGPREIDELHVPAGVPVKLTMTSQDVIRCSFYIPASRVKKDVLPARYTPFGSEATETGTFHSSACNTAARIIPR